MLLSSARWNRYDTKGLMIEMNRLRFIYTMILACTAVACNSVVIDAPQQYGEISLVVGTPDVQVVVKAENENLKVPDNPEDFTVRIFNSAGEKKHEVTYDRFTEPKLLPFDTYSVTVEDCTEAEAESQDKMRLAGMADGIVLDASHLSQSVDVECTVANTKVSVVYDSSVSEWFTRLDVSLERAAVSERRLTDRSMRFTLPGFNDEDEISFDHWFAPSELTYTIDGIFKPDTQVKPTGTISLEAGKHVRIILKIDREDGMLEPEVSIEYDDIDYTEYEQGFNPYA